MYNHYIYLISFIVFGFIYYNLFKTKKYDLK